MAAKYHYESASGIKVKVFEQSFIVEYPTGATEIMWVKHPISSEEGLDLLDRFAEVWEAGIEAGKDALKKSLKALLEIK
jgi:hypothetical protein